MTDPDDYEDEWQELDEKVLLAQILAELQQIRLTLQEGADDAQDDSDADVMYQCRRCAGDVTVPAARRERHARSEHNCPPGEELSWFKPVE